MTISRFGLFLWKSHRVADTELSLGTFFLQGLRADIIQVSLLSVPLVLLLLLFSNRWGWAVWRVSSYSWVVFSILLLTFMEVSTPSFISQYDLRPNRLFIEYLAYPQEVFATVWVEFRVAFILAVGLTLVLCGLCIVTLLPLLPMERTWSGWTQAICFPIVLVAVFMGTRSTLDHRPANPALFALTNDPLVNSLIINSSWSVVHAIYNLKHESKSSDVYGKLDTETILKQTGLWRDEAMAMSENPTMRFHEASVKLNRSLNLVIVLQESLGATFVGSLGGRGVTPELEKLKDEGWWFENLYATGTRSVRGIEAVISGFLPTPSRSVVKLSLSQNNFFTIAGLLENEGYSTEFIYGGEAHFDNMRAFFSGNGFQSVVDQYDYENPVFHGTWGVSDEDLFAKADERLSKQYAEGKPFFDVVFTSSNHSPFEYPEGRIELFDENPATANNAVKYADYALGKFFEKAKTQPYWKDTLFLVVADHDIRVHGDDLVPIKHFHIPGLILGADIQPKRIKTVASQIDLPTTLLSLMGVSASHPMVGRDLTKEDIDEPGRAIMQYADHFCIMEGDDVVILRPEKGPVFGRYDFDNKTLDTVNEGNPEFALRALAYSHLPSWLYRNQLYHRSNSPQGIDESKLVSKEKDPVLEGRL